MRFARPGKAFVYCSKQDSSRCRAQQIARGESRATRVGATHDSVPGRAGGGAQDPLVVKWWSMTSCMVPSYFKQRLDDSSSRDPTARLPIFLRVVDDHGCDHACDRGDDHETTRATIEHVLAWGQATRISTCP